MKLPYKIILLTLSVAFVFTGHTVEAATKKKTVAKPKKPVYSRIFYYQEGKKARASFAAHIKSVDILAPQVYNIDSEGNLSGKLNANTLALAKKNKVKVMPLFVNKNFSKSGAEAFLDNEIAQDEAVASLIKEAKKYGYWGWQIDFEQTDASYRDKFSAFTKKLYDASQAHKLALSVAVIAQNSGDPDDYPKKSWQNVVGVFDYAALASSTNFLSIMSYDDPWSKGPIARYSWLKEVLDYATKYVPADKLSLGIPLYYWQWNDDTDKLVGIGGYTGIQNVLKKYRAKINYSPVEEAPYITYKKKKTNYVIWYENAKSVKKKMDLIKDYGLHGFSAWSIGLEVPNIFSAVKI